MIGGYILTSRDIGVNYLGIDSVNHEYIWKDIHLWNDKYPEDQIYLKGGIYLDSCTKSLMKYYDWLKNLYENQIHTLLYFTLDLNNTIETNNLNSEFQFLGYDCLYFHIDEIEPSDSVLFSSLYNERKVNKNSQLGHYQHYINKFGLFNDVEMAYNYIKTRDNMLLFQEGNLETAYPELDMIIIKTYKVVPRLL